LIGLVLLLLAGCGGGPELARLPPDAVVLAFGDSLTAGTGAAAGEDYPSRLATLSGLSIINAGAPGELSAQGLERLPALLAEHRPALVLLCHGGNDILRRGDGEQLRANLRGMIATVRASGADVVLLAVPTLGLGLRPHPAYAELAKEHGLIIEQRALTDVLSDPALKADGVHPNAAGYALLAERLDRLLREHGALY
jgi:lysophospholipase L1-like esterase